MQKISIERSTSIVKQIANDLKFDHCGISKAEYLKEEAPRLEFWLKNRFHGKMDYMTSHFEKRLNPSRLVEGARSIISLLYNYYPERNLPVKNTYKIAKYAYGTDYHFIIKKKLKEFLFLLNDKIGDIHGRGFVDSAPVLERQLAARSGLGWIGKNTMLINKEKGSFFFLAELITDLELIPDSPIGDYCGTCSRCIEACPTEALTPFQMDATKCISYLTIELKDQIPQSFKGKMKDWIFGCDICQDVCPWNRFSKAHREPEFVPNHELYNFDKQTWEEMTEETFLTVFQKSTLKRTKYKGLKRNILFAREERL